MNSFVIKKLEQIKFNVDSPFLFLECLIFDGQLLIMTDSERQIKNLLNSKDEECDIRSLNYLRLVLNMLNSDYKTPLMNAKHKISECLNGGDIKESFGEFERIISQLTPGLYYSTEKLFVYEAVVQLLTKTSDEMFVYDGGAVVITSELYRIYTDKIISGIMPVLTSLYNVGSEDVVQNIYDYLLKDLANNCTLAKSPIDAILDSMELLQYSLYVYKPKDGMNIYENIYNCVCSTALNKDLEEYFPDIMHTVQRKIQKNTKYYEFNIRSFAHLIFVVMYLWFSKRLDLKVCPVCNRYFVPSRSNNMYCDGTIPGTDRKCAKAGPQIIRNQNMPKHKYEFEKCKKSLRKYLNNIEGIDKDYVKNRIKDFNEFYTNAEMEYNNSDESEEDFIQRIKDTCNNEYKTTKNP